MGQSIPFGTDVRVPLTVLLNENPFHVLGLPLTANPRDVRRRLDDMEMDVALSGTGVHDRAALVRAARTLEDPAQRIECELFCRWAEEPRFAYAAGHHDVAIESTRRVMDRQQTSSSGDGASAIAAWSATLGDEAVADVIRQRCSDLGIEPTKNWPWTEIGSSVLSPIIGRTLESARGGWDQATEAEQTSVAQREWLAACVQLADSVSKLDPTNVQPAAEALAGQIETATMRNGRFTELTPEESQSTISALDEAARRIEITAPDAAGRIRSRLTETIDRKAARLFSEGRKAEAESLLVALLNAGISEADRIKIRHDLRSVRFTIAWEQANEHVEYGEWQAAAEAYERAAAFAPDADTSERARQNVVLVHRARMRGLPGKRVRARPGRLLHTTSDTSTTVWQPSLEAQSRDDAGTLFGRQYGSSHAEPQRRRRVRIPWWVAVAAVIGGCTILANIDVDSNQESSTPATRPLPTSVSMPSRTPLPVTPQPVGALPYVVNSLPVGCHQTYDAGSEITLNRTPGTVQTMDKLIRQTNGTWHHDKEGNCWVRTDPGPVRAFRTIAEAQDYAATLAPQPIAMPTFVVNSAPIGCHQTPDAAATIVVQRPIGTVQAVDAFMKMADGVWNREVDRQCWVRIQPGPVREFRTVQEAETHAAATRRAAFRESVTAARSGLNVAVTFSSTAGVQTYNQARATPSFAGDADRIAAAARQLREVAQSTLVSPETAACRDALIRWGTVEERYWTDLAAAVRFGNPQRWDAAVDIQDSVNNAIRASNEQCRGV
jgi:hypothetical protein